MGYNVMGTLINLTLNQQHKGCKKWRHLTTFWTHCTCKMQIITAAAVQCRNKEGWKRRWMENSEQMLGVGFRWWCNQVQARPTTCSHLPTEFHFIIHLLLNVFSSSSWNTKFPWFITDKRPDFTITSEKMSQDKACALVICLLLWFGLLVSFKII